MKIIILFILAYFITISSCVVIVKRLQASETFCFSDDIPQHTLIKLKTTVDNPIQLEIYSTNVRIKSLDLFGQNVESWTSQRYGIFKFCFTNSLGHEAVLKYDYAIGQRANDFTSSYQGADYIKSLENQARIAQTFIKQIQNENSEGIQIMISQNLQANSYACVYAFSTFFVGISMALTYVQFKMVRKHLRNRKYL